ncbi:MAG: hypothetical protein R6V67_10535 [Spirochaetia bacterium]
MKSTLLVLPVFAALFCAVFLFLGSFTSVYYWMETSHAVEELGFSVLVPHVLDKLPSITVFSAILSLFLLMFTFRKRQHLGFFDYALTFAAAMLVYGGLFMALSDIDTKRDISRIASPFDAQQIYPVGDYLFYGEQVEYTSETGDSRLEGEIRPSFAPVVIVSPLIYGDSSLQGIEDHHILSLYRRALVDDLEGEFILQDTIFGGAEERSGADGEGAADPDKDSAQRIPLRSKSWSVLVYNDPPSIVSSVAHEAELVSQALRRLLDGSLVFYAATVGIHVFFVVVSIFFIRTIPWPLVSALVVLLFMRGFFFLYRLAESDVAAELMKGLSLEKFSGLAPAAVLLVLSILFLLWNTAFYFGKKEQS